jgi:hypothetical protein
MVGVVSIHRQPAIHIRPFVRRWAIQRARDRHSGNRLLDWCPNKQEVSVGRHSRALPAGLRCRRSSESPGPVEPGCPGPLSSLFRSFRSGGDLGEEPGKCGRGCAMEPDGPTLVGRVVPIGSEGSESTRQAPSRDSGGGGRKRVLSRQIRGRGTYLPSWRSSMASTPANSPTRSSPAWAGERRWT